jgi:hypothetical protein
VSLTLELQGRTNRIWSLTSRCLDHVVRLQTTDARTWVERLFGEESTNAGTRRTVPRERLLEAVKALAPLVKNLPAGFEMLVPALYPGMEMRWGGGGFSPLIIEGRHHHIRCEGDHWCLQSIDDLREWKEPVARYDAAEIPTENLGVFKVRPKKSRSDLSKLLREVQAFLENDPSDEIRVIWG